MKPTNGSNRDPMPFDPALASLRAQTDAIAPGILTGDPLQRPADAARAPVTVETLFPKGAIK